MNENSSCFSKILKFIDELQKSTNIINDNEGCSRPFLGNITTGPLFNTRPVTFYNCNNELITIQYTAADGTASESSTFRIEKVDNNCVKVLLLALETDGSYTSTNQTAIINLCCVCAIKCLGDTFVTL